MKKILAIFLIICMLTAALAACDEKNEKTTLIKDEGSILENNTSDDKGGTSNDDEEDQVLQSLSFEINSDGMSYSVIGIGTCTDEDLVIPEVYNDLPVTRIEAEAFRNDYTLISVTIPDSVTGIGDRAFYECSYLINVTIGNGVTDIGSEVFSGCDRLTSVTIGSDVTSIGENAFQGCIQLVEVINKSELNITAGSSENGLVGYYAMEVHNGESKIANKDGYLFYTYCGVNYLLGHTEVHIKQLVLPTDYNGEIYEIYKYAFASRYGLTSITIPDSVTSIGERAFNACASLASVTISNGVTSIGEWAFHACSSLASITIGKGVTSIGENAFQSCEMLVEVINKSELNITAGSSENGRVGYYAMEVHNGESKMANKDGYLFYTYCGVNYLFGFRFKGDETELVLPTNYNGENYEIYKRAFFRGCGLTSITIPNSVTSIGSYAFYDCSGLTSIAYNGTKEQWKAIDKGSWWNDYTGNYTVTCTDGVLTKAES